MALEVLDDITNCMENGWSDGLPVIPPYGSLVDEMLEALGWKNTDVIGEIADQNLLIRAEHLAATAVMAGCKIEYAPILRALSKCLVESQFLYFVSYLIKWSTVEGPERVKQCKLITF